MNTDYKKICLETLKDLPKKQKEIILRRFGLERGERETLEFIGRDFGITRERVRQIESDGLSRLKEKIKSHQKIFQYFTEELKKSGDLKKEEILLSQLGGNSYQPHIFFLLTLGEPFQRFAETDRFYSLWTINPYSLKVAQGITDSFYKKLKEVNRPFTLEEYKASLKMSPHVLSSYLEISKIIQKNEEGFYGLKEWPEINPRGVKNKAYVVFKKEKKPLHFTEVAELIGPEALPQTVHNELIKDGRFVLVGRGLYALKEWGYEVGQVKDVIAKVLREAGKPLLKEEIMERVLKQRLVKENTVLLNLNNKKYFLKTPEGKYVFKEARFSGSKYPVQKA